MLYTLVLPHFAHVHIDSGLRPGAPENIKEPGEAVASTHIDNDVDETAATARVISSSAERRRKQRRRSHFGNESGHYYQKRSSSR